MVRKPNKVPTHEVKPKLPADAFACLQQLADMGRYGSNPTEVAKYLILRELDDLTRQGVLSVAKQSPKG